MGTAAPEAWETLADVLLQREALVCRVGRGLAPRDFAGLYVDDDDVARILAELPGLDGPAAEAVDPVRAATQEQVATARAAFEASLTGGSVFAGIARRAELDPAEAEVLAVVAAVELSPERQRLVAYLQDSIQCPRPGLPLLRRLLPEPHPGPRALAPASRLRRAGLVALDDGSWATRMVGLAERVCWALAGDDSPDPALPPGATQATPEGVDPEGAALLLVPGGDRLSRLRAAWHGCRGERFLTCPTPATPQAWEAVVREATVAGLSIVLEVDGELSAEGRARIDQTPHLAWALLSPHELPLSCLPDRGWRETHVTTHAADSREWEQVIGTADGRGHRLTSEQLAAVAAAIGGLDGDVDAAVRRLASGQLDGLALRVRPRRGWADLVIGADQSARLRELEARYRHSRTVHEQWGFESAGAGLVAVFSGPSGTGKTLAAEVLAGQLGLDLFKVDLSSVVSKYIGETEKNLERIFSSAAAANVVLFFDEADALFGKRSEVSDAHDRYANIEVSYLLQRLEAYDGLVVLATNLQRNMDAAFLRRVHVAVDFPLPDEAARRAIWTLAFPPSAPTGDIDLDFLAGQFRVSGASITNAATAAAFLATAEDSDAITMRHVMLALKREFQKLGRLCTEAEFERYSDLVAATPEEVDGDAALAR